MLVLNIFILSRGSDSKHLAAGQGGKRASSLGPDKLMRWRCVILRPYAQSFFSASTLDDIEVERLESLLFLL